MTLFCAVQESLQTGINSNSINNFSIQKVPIVFQLKKNWFLLKFYEKFYLKCKLCIELWYGITFTLVNNDKGTLRICTQNAKKNLILLMGLYLE